jgi:BTB/POZ domain
MAIPTPNADITFDSYGDYILIIGDGETQKRFLVSSNAMRLASPVWKAMITGPYEEATAKEISFPEGKPEAFLIVLRIAHLQFEDLPSSLDFQELVNLAIICEEYDLVRIVRPFLKRWIEPLEPLAEKIGFEEWLFVAWTFSYPKVFEKITQKLVLNASTNADGQCLNEAEDVLDDRFMPPGIIGKLSAPRIHTWD